MVEGMEERGRREGGREGGREGLRGYMYIHVNKRVSERERVRDKELFICQKQQRSGREVLYSHYKHTLCRHYLTIHLCARIDKKNQRQLPL